MFHPSSLWMTMTLSLFRRVISVRYIFLLSGLVFILWSLAIILAPPSSLLFALLQMDLELPTMAETRLTDAKNMDRSDFSSLKTRPSGIGIARAHIYIVSLPGRTDRRDQMELLRAFQGLTWTIVDAIPSNATLVGHILDRVALQRAETKTSVPFRWPEEIDALSVSSGPWKPSGSDAWADTPPSKSSSHPVRFSRLLSATEDDSMPTFADETPEWMVLSPARIACWHSHVLAIRRFVQGRDRRWDDVAVILEDDIDMEKDVPARLSRVWTFLPPGWDMVFLGHCWSDESYYPPLTDFVDTNVHPSRHPKCTHAYALSLSGAQRLLQHLRHPPFAYSRALDQAYAWLVRSGRLRSYSVVPSLVVQRKLGRSDISSGSGSEWKQGLRNGVFGA